MAVWTGRRSWVGPHKRQQGKSKWQSYSQGWKPYNKPHCLSVGCLLFAIFLYKLLRGEKKNPLFALFPPIDISSTDSVAHFVTSFQSLPPPPPPPPFPPLVGWLSSAVAYYSSWQCQPLFLPLTHKLRICSSSPPILKWILLAWSEESHSPPLYATSLCFCFVFTSESFIGMIQWQ